MYTVANIGREECSLRSALIGAYIPLPLLLYSPDNIIYCALCGSLYVQFRGVHWRRNRRRYSFGVRVCGLMLACSVYSSLWTVTLLHSAYVTTEFGDKVLLKDAAEIFFTSDAWADTQQTCFRLWKAYQEEGMIRLLTELLAAIDPEGEAYSYKVRRA